MITFVIVLLCILLFFMIIFKARRSALVTVILFNIVTFATSLFWHNKTHAPQYVEGFITLCLYFWFFVLIGLFGDFTDCITKDVKTYHNLTRKCACLPVMIEEYKEILEKAPEDLTFEEVVIVYTIYDLHKNFDNLYTRASDYNSKCNGFFRTKYLSRFDLPNYELLCRANYWYKGCQKDNLETPDLNKYHLHINSDKLFDIHIL